MVTTTITSASIPINPNGVRDDAHGITTFVDGIGGQDGRSGSQTSIAQAASAVYLDTFPPGAWSCPWCDPVHPARDFGGLQIV